MGLCSIPWKMAVRQVRCDQATTRRQSRSRCVNQELGIILADLRSEDVINGTFQIPRPDRKVVINSSTAIAGELDASEQASVRRRKTAGLDTLVGQIIGEGKNLDTPKRGASAILEEPTAKRPKPAAKSSMVHLSRSTSFATADVPTCGLPTTNDTEEKVTIDESKHVARIFEGLRMAVCKSKGWEAMLEALSSRGAILVDEKDWMKGETCNYAIIRL